jgi:tetratricopeptide (TPR) repeat protein
MKFNGLIITALLIVLPGFTRLSAQIPTPTPSIEVSREKREQAFAKLYEAQRWIWMMKRTRSQTVLVNSLKSAREALKKAIELNPNLAEAYTTLAELNIIIIPGNKDEALLLAGIASKLNPDNFGARQILAQVYTEKSLINTENLESNFAQKAVSEWKEVTRLDPRNAEAWAFLSVFYERLNKSDERIAALRKWLSSTAPMERDQFFYRRLFGKSEDLSPENAALKLGDALIKSEQSAEAVEVLSRTIADQPDNALAIDLLRQAIQISEVKTTNKTIELIQQAVFANPSNLALIELLSETQIRLGKTDDAVKTLNNFIQSANKSDKSSIANLQVSLGDIYLQASRSDEALSVYEQALTSFGIEKTPLTTEDQREFAVRVFEKIIRTLKNAGKSTEAKAVIERARILLGSTDLFADKQLITLLRESGKKDEALSTIRTLRKNFADDYPLLRTEATILTELGRVEEGVALIKELINQKSAVPSAYYDDFSNYLFISGLYTQAKKTKEAIETAQKAFGVAESSERKQLANLSLATAQHLSGNHQLAESTLRGILKQTPDNPIALNNLGYFLLERNDRIAEAVKMIEQALKIDPTNASYLDSLGWGYYKLGKLEESERYLKEAIRYNPASSATFEHLGDLYLKQGKADLAKSAWQKAIAFSSDPEARNRLKAKVGQ